MNKTINEDRPYTAEELESLGERLNDSIEIMELLSDSINLMTPINKIYNKEDVYCKYIANYKLASSMLSVLTILKEEIDDVSLALLDPEAFEEDKKATK